MSQVQLWAGLCGTIKVGSRTPVDAPPWVTLDVGHGGFAVGTFTASLPPADAPGDEAAADAWATNEAWLTPEGFARLTDLLDTGAYHVAVPEHGALLAVAWLVQQDLESEATAVVAALRPWMGTLRFFPTVTLHPVPLHAVSVLPRDEATAQLQRLAAAYTSVPVTIPTSLPNPSPTDADDPGVMCGMAQLAALRDEAGRTAKALSMAPVMCHSDSDSDSDDTSDDTIGAYHERRPIDPRSAHRLRVLKRHQNHADFIVPLRAIAVSLLLETASVAPASYRRLMSRPLYAAAVSAARTAEHLSYAAWAMYLALVDGAVSDEAEADAVALWKVTPDTHRVERTAPWPLQTYPQSADGDDDIVPWADSARLFAGMWQLFLAVFNADDAGSTVSGAQGSPTSCLCVCADAVMSIAGRAPAAGRPWPYLAPRAVGCVRAAVAMHISAHGVPGSRRYGSYVRAVAASRPHDVASVVAAVQRRFDETPGVHGVGELNGPITAGEVPAAECPAHHLLGTPHRLIGQPLPRALGGVAQRSASAPLEALIDAGIVASPDVLAVVGPAAVAPCTAVPLSAPDLLRVCGTSAASSAPTAVSVPPQAAAAIRMAAALLTALQRSFDRRRSLLLLDYATQVRLTELPWFTSVYRAVFTAAANASLATVHVAPPPRSVLPAPGAVSKVRGAQRKVDAVELSAPVTEAVDQLVSLWWRKFPETPPRNKIIRALKSTMSRFEGQAAALQAILDGTAPPGSTDPDDYVPVPLTEELAADIFMGGFSGTFAAAAAEASETMQDTLYARYFRLGRSYAALDGGASIGDVVGLALADVLGLDAGHATDDPPTKKRRGATAAAGDDSSVVPTAAGVDIRSLLRVRDRRLAIEAQQVLTTHNMAQLMQRLSPDAAAAFDVRAAAAQCWERILDAVAGQPSVPLPAAQYQATIAGFEHGGIAVESSDGTITVGGQVMNRGRGRGGRGGQGGRGQCGRGAFIGGPFNREHVSLEVVAPLRDSPLTPAERCAAAAYRHHFRGSVPLARTWSQVRRKACRKIASMMRQLVFYLSFVSEMPAKPQQAWRPAAFTSFSVLGTLSDPQKAQLAMVDSFRAAAAARIHAPQPPHRGPAPEVDKDVLLSEIDRCYLSALRSSVIGDPDTPPVFGAGPRPLGALTSAQHYFNVALMTDRLFD